MASGDKNYDIARQSTLTTSVGSSDSEIINTSLFGKINNLINTLATHVANWTSARAEKIDTIATDSASAKADAASNKSTLSTLSTTIGTINTNAARLTSTRAGYIDRLANSTYGLSALKTAIDGIGGVSLTGVGKTLYSSSTAISTGENTYNCLAKFIAPVEGWYTITVSESGGSQGLIVYTVRHGKGSMYTLYDSDTNNYYYDPAAHMLFVDNVVKSIYDNSTVGAFAMYDSSNTISYAYIAEDIAPIPDALHSFMSIPKGSSGTYHMFCYAGEPIVLMGCSYGGSCKMGSISITYGSN